jgi:hypothetical protein
MSATTAMLTDIGTVITNGPGATTIATVTAAAGPNFDYKGMIELIKLKAQDLSVMISAVKSATDGSDSNLTNINKLLATIAGTSTPSATMITHWAAVVLAGPTAATTAKAIAAAGPITDYVSMLQQVSLRLKELKNLVTLVWTYTDASDTANLALLASIKLALT